MLPLVGFLASSFAFVAAAARLMGVRSPVSLLLYAGLFSLVLVLALSQAVRLPDPLIVDWFESQL